MDDKIAPQDDYRTPFLQSYTVYSIIWTHCYVVALFYWVYSVPGELQDKSLFLLNLPCKRSLRKMCLYMYGLVQDCSNSIDYALALLLSCPKPSYWIVSFRDKLLSYHMLPFAVNSFDPFFGFATLKYPRTSNISGTLEGNKIVDHSNVVGASPVGAVPTTSLSWLQWIGQRQLQEETIKTEVLGFDASWFSGLTVYIGHPFPYYRPHLCDKSTCPATQRVCIVEISFFLCFFLLISQRAKQ